MRITVTATGTTITFGMRRPGGTTIILIGFGITIAIGSLHIRTGAPTMATMTRSMFGVIAIGGTPIIRIGCANITMTGRDGMTRKL